MISVRKIKRTIAKRRMEIGVTQREMSQELELSGDGMEKFESHLAKRYVEFINVLAILDLAPMDFMSQKDVDEAEACLAALKEIGKERRRKPGYGENIRR